MAIKSSQINATDLDFDNSSNKFNKELPRIENFEKFTINRTHVWFSLKLFLHYNFQIQQN